MTLAEVLAPDGIHVAPWLARRYPFVQRHPHQSTSTPYGTVAPALGFLHDGSSRLFETSEEAGETHDWLYLLPEAVDATGEARRLTLRQCDWIYARMTVRSVHPLLLPGELVVAAGSFVVLDLFNRLPGSPWARYRKRERAMGAAAWREFVMQTRVLPEAGRWQFPTNRLADARLAV